jgi:hypothetical protein
MNTNKTRIRRNLAITLMLCAVLFVAALAVGNYQASKIAEASSVDGYALYTWTNNSITTTANLAGRFTGDYGRFECYSTVDATAAQTVTIKLESSPENTNFAAIPMWQFSSNVLAADADMADVTADGTTFAIAVLEGLYTRPVVTLGTSNPVTVTLKCIGKDRPGYDLDQNAGALEMTD